MLIHIFSILLKITKSITNTDFFILFNSLKTLKKGLKIQSGANSVPVQVWPGALLLLKFGLLKKEEFSFSIKLCAPCVRLPYLNKILSI